MNNENGFTLIEMMIVLLVISVLLIITVPNITKHNSTINSKGCDAFIKMVEGQVQAYSIDKKKSPASLDELVDDGYLSGTKCPDGRTVSLTDGLVTPSAPTP